MTHKAIVNLPKKSYSAYSIKNVLQKRGQPTEVENPRWIDSEEASFFKSQCVSRLYRLKSKSPLVRKISRYDQENNTSSFLSTTRRKVLSSNEPHESKPPSLVEQGYLVASCNSPPPR